MGTAYAIGDTCCRNVTFLPLLKPVINLCPRSARHAARVADYGNRHMTLFAFSPETNFLIFSGYGASLLIVLAVFFIQRRDGEVAEWSKALPC